MEFLSGTLDRKQEISDLFCATFTASEGADEGRLIGALAANLIETTPTKDLFVFSAYEGQTLVGSILFSRLTFEQDQRNVFILSPVAVRTDRQKTGVGQKLITFGLDALRQDGIDVVFTYGDPNYYSKVGFRQITEDVALAPVKLNYPHGWVAQSLSGKDMAPFIGPSSCVDALNKPELW